MNYYPYINAVPYTTTLPKTSFFKSLFGDIKLGSILSGTQKTLSVVNQAIPLIKQAGPMLNNAKTMFRVMNEFKKTDVIETPTNSVKETKTSESIKNVNQTNGPVFFQ